MDVESGEAPTVKVEHHTRWYLVVEKGPDAGKKCAVSREVALVGAAPAATLLLTDDSVSRFHLEVSAFSEGLLLRDLSSTNGTLVMGARIRDAIVGENESFHVGETVVRVLSVESKDEANATSSARSKSSIVRVVQACRGNITRAARRLGVPEPLLFDYLRRHRIDLDDM